MTAERFASDNIQEIIDKYKDKISVGDYKQLLNLIKETGDYQMSLIEQLNKATERINDLEEENLDLHHGLEEAGKIMELLRDLGHLIDKAKKNPE